MGQSVVGVCGLALVVLVGATTGAAAAETPIYAAVPAWVKPTALPTSAPLDRNPAAVRTLLYDTQLSVQSEALATYTAYARKIETAQGLNGVSSIEIAWNPDLEMLTIHHVRIRRGEATVDLLQGGRAVSILRRENNLEYRTLDGVLSATLQPAGLQVGDIVEVAYTTVELDPNLGGHVQAIAAPLTLRNPQVVNFRAVLPNDRKLTWRGANLPADLKRGGGELTMYVDNPAQVEPPRGAPGRYQMESRIELGDFASWPEVSAVFHPLYEKARTLAADSPLKAEIEKIKASSSDPVVQASAALALVEDKVRYFAVALDKGGYRPANADDTWSRRYGDSKAKTALLLALLDGLDIKAQAALVSTEHGDGLDKRLPMPRAFNHIVVHTEIDGRVYWLDGTRSGDTTITALSPPDYVWGLPLSAAGQALEPITLKAPDKPESEIVELYDLSAGLHLFATVRLEMTVRGDGAYFYRAIPAAFRDATTKTAWTRLYPSLKLANSSVSVDPVTGEVRLTADGQMLMGWGRRSETMRATELANARLRVGETFDHYPSPTGVDAQLPKPAKPPIRNEDAPFAVDFPTYSVTQTKVILPKGVGGFSLLGADVDRTLGGRAIKRTASLSDGVITVSTSVRTLTSEISAADAKAAKQALNQIAADRVGIVAPEALFSPQKRFDEVWAKVPITRNDYFLRADALDSRLMHKDALAAIDKAIGLGEDSAAAHGLRARQLQAMRRFPEANAEIEAAIASPGATPALIASLRLEQARIEAVQGNYKAALVKLDGMVETRPNDAETRLLRGQTRRSALQEDGALVDFDAAIDAAPNNLTAYTAKASLLGGQKKHDAAVGALIAMTTNNPLNPDAYVRAAQAYDGMGRVADARAAVDRSLIIKPTADAYLSRARLRPASENVQARTDIAAALALDSAIRNLSIAGQLQITLHDYEGAVRSLEAGKKLSDDNSFMSYLVAAYEGLGQPALAAKEHAAARSIAGKNANALNRLCWAQATAKVALTRALSDCDASLALSRIAPIHDSRGLVLLQLGRNADAIAAYDRALDMRPKQASSLYGRGLAKLAAGDVQGQADLQAARDLQPSVVAEFTRYGFMATAQ